MSYVSAIDPRQPFVWSGSRVTLTCSLSNSSVNVNASDFYFYSSSPELREKLLSERVNQTSIRTNVTGINRNMSSENISCRFQNETLDQVTLFVAGTYDFHLFKLFSCPTTQRINLHYFLVHIGHNNALQFLPHLFPCCLYHQ